MLTTTDGDNSAKKERPRELPLNPVMLRVKSNLIKTAKELDKNRLVYLIYGLLDGASIGYSSVRACFDIIYTNSDRFSLDEMDNWLATDFGFSTVLAETAVLTMLAGLSNYWSAKDRKNKEEAYKRIQSQIAYLWPYIRDALKGVKNGYRGIRSAFSILSSLASVDLRYAVLPVGLALGGLSMLNRAGIRYYREQRKKYEDSYPTNLDEIDLDQTNLYYQKLEKHKKKLAKGSTLALASCSYAGIVDGLYLYTGAIALSSVNYPLFVTLSAFSGFYALVCIATRIYEEYRDQQQFERKQMELRQRICYKELQIEDGNFRKVFSVKIDPSTWQDDQAAALDKLEKILDQFNKNRIIIRGYNTLSLPEIVLSGLRNGITAYSAVSSVMFLVAAVTFMLNVPFPSFLMIAGIISGMVCLLACTAHSFYLNYPALELNEAKSPSPAAGADIPLHSSIITLKAKIEEARKDMRKLDEMTMKEMAFHLSNILDGAATDSNPQFQSQEIAMEIIRSSAGAGPKGRYFINLLMRSHKIIGEDGHWHESHEMFLPAVCLGAGFGVSFGARAFTNGFKNQDDSESEKPIPAPAGFFSSDSKGQPPQTPTAIPPLEVDLSPQRSLSTECSTSIPPSPGSSPFTLFNGFLGNLRRNLSVDSLPPVQRPVASAAPCS